MAVELNKLYRTLDPKREARLLTHSCFQKQISWVHMVENIDFVSLLHGDELVFNSSLNDEPDIFRKEFISKLIEVDAGGLIIAIQEEHSISEELIDYCNSVQFPLFQANWETSYLNIMRRFSEILLDNERNETNLTSAFKNATYYPENENLYINHFERNNYYRDAKYTVVILGCSSKKDVYPLSNLKQLEASVRRIYRQSITYDEKECIVILIPEYSVDELETEFDSLLKKHPYLRIGIGSSVMRLEQLHLSYRNALTAYQLATAVKEEAILCFDHLGIYQVLAGVKDPQTLYPHFVKQILGPLMEYDSEHHSNYMLILEEYFENDCSITQTANATFFHQNTLKYKVKNIKEILGYDITENKHRVNIILALSMLHMGEDFFGES